MTTPTVKIPVSVMETLTASPKEAVGKSLKGVIEKVLKEKIPLKEENQQLEDEVFRLMEELKKANQQSLQNVIEKMSKEKKNRYFFDDPDKLLAVAKESGGMYTRSVFRAFFHLKTGKSPSKVSTMMGYGQSYITQGISTINNRMKWNEETLIEKIEEIGGELRPKDKRFVALLANRLLGAATKAL